MNDFYDVIVAGLGAMGSLTTYQLARRGHRVLGLDRFTPPHAMGSSHGFSRIIREAYFEDPRYVPLVQQAYEEWATLEARSNVRVFRQTGGLMLGPPDGVLVSGALRSAELHGLPHELLSAREVAARFPAFAPDAAMVGVVEPRAGILSPELAIGAALDVARTDGATIHVGESLLSWHEVPGGVEVVTTGGRYRAGSLLISVGAWTRDVVEELALPLVVQRNVQHWFTPLRSPQHFAAEHLPIFIGEYAPGKAWYGFPDVGDGLKVALHHHGEVVHPDTVNRDVAPDEVESVREILARYMPDANGTWRHSAVCMYTNAPDEHFVIGRHPWCARVVVASPCSGHGFKFASVLGDVLADLTTDCPPAYDLSLFALDRDALRVGS
ncbi:MAG: N-methyl-L-tryptophan oxidase [Gemmatimonadaceae bacterium]|nr:N-methyl-L-tryptophan oxidase [Gemmatimonadaceae bacterium]